MKDSTLSGQGHLGGKAVELMNQLHAVVRRYLFQERTPVADDVALTRQEVRVIAALGRRETWTMGELAADVMLAVGSLTVIVDRLVAKGMVDRRRSATDRRVVHVTLTAAGRRRYAKRRRKRLRMARAMLAALAPHEQDTFLRLMRKIRERAVGPEEPPPRSGREEGEPRITRIGKMRNP